jgi:hypothetical protein
MQAAVKRDTTVRTIMLEVQNVPDVDVTRYYHRKPRIFRPDSVTIKLVDGTVERVTVSGGLVLKSGAASTEVSEKEQWFPGSSWSPKLSEAPEWLALLVDQAPQGLTTWRTGADAGEVQAL